VAGGTLTLHNATLALDDGTSVPGVRVVSSNDPDFVLLVEGVDAATLAADGAFGGTETAVAEASEGWTYDASSGTWSGGPGAGDGGDDGGTTGEPGDSGDPEDPTDPEDPVGPTDPEEPMDSTNPNEGEPGTGEPEKPTDPTNPDDPGDPENPTDPDDGEPTDDDDPDDEPRPETDTNDSWVDRTCFVATAAYGDPRHPEVVALRRWRDQVLVRTPLGRAFVAFYWRVGPLAARHVAADQASGRWARRVLGWISRRV
jgi:hypothetical protein